MRSLLLFLLALSGPVVWAKVLEGRVVSVADGDTITLLDRNRQQHKIRLAGIDAPEKARPYGQRSKQHLADLAFGKNAKADCYKIERYDRDACTVNGQDHGLAQLDAGLAWWYRKSRQELHRQKNSRRGWSNSRKASGATWPSSTERIGIRMR